MTYEKSFKAEAVRLSEELRRDPEPQRRRALL